MRLHKSTPCVQYIRDQITRHVSPRDELQALKEYRADVVAEPSCRRAVSRLGADVTAVDASEE